MNVGRGQFATVVLHDGRVLAAVGIATDGTAIAGAEIYNSVKGTLVSLTDNIVRILALSSKSDR
jgi:hypothetical protein